MKYDISICTISTNEWYILKDCIDSIIREANKNLSIQLIIINNFSDDYNYKLLKRFNNKYLEINVIENNKKLNFSVNNNIAIRNSLSDILLILNPDTIIQRGTLKFMVDYLRNSSEIGAATCKLTYADGSFQDNCRKFIRLKYLIASRLRTLGFDIFKKTYNEYIMSKENDKEPKEVDYVLGACMFIKKDVINQVGMFDERFILYAEDTDLCYRIKQSGWKIMYIPNVSITHLYARTAKNIFSKAALLQIYTTILFYLKHYLKILK